MNSTLLKSIISYLVTKFWPWFKAVVWPFLKEHILEIIMYFIAKFKDWIKHWFETRSERRSQEAKQKAQEAETRAQESESSAEADYWKKVAEIWREVAEQYRRDFEDFKSDLRNFKEDVETEAASTVDDINIDVDLGSEKPILTIANKKHELPNLPAISK